MQVGALIDLRGRLECEHTAQLEQFQRHQECLIARDARRALEILMNLENQLVQHMELEERYLLPLCEPRTHGPGHWGPQVYAQEHRKIQELLASIRLRIATHCVSGDGTILPADIIDLLDREKVLKNLMSHHQTREETALYPGILNKQ